MKSSKLEALSGVNGKIRGFKKRGKLKLEETKGAEV